MKKGLSFIIGIALLVCFLGLASVKYSAYFILDKEERQQLILEIENSPKLTSRFYEIYELIKPKTLKPSCWPHIFTHRSDNSNYCACREAVYMAIYPNYTSAFEIMPIVSFVESQISQQKCLDYYVFRLLKENDINVRHILGKEINELDDRELVKLILIIQNPYLYKNKVKRDGYIEKLENRIDSIMRKIEAKN